MKMTDFIANLHALKLPIVTFADLRKVAAVSNDYTAYKLAERLVKKGILQRLKKGLYAFRFLPPSDFAIANALYPPSYISFESALSFYGVLPSFPYAITSATPKKTKRFIVQGRMFAYERLKTKYYFGFERIQDFLMATPEKALLDSLYLLAKGFKRLSLDELHVDQIDKTRLKPLACHFEVPRLQELLKGLGLL